MALTPAVLSHIDQYKNLKTRTIAEAGKLGKALTEGHLQTFNFSSLKAIIADWKSKNDLLITSEAASQKALYQNRSGKVALVGGRLIYALTILSCIALVIFEKFYPPASGQDTIGFYTTLLAGAGAYLQMGNEMGKDFSNEEANAIKITPPESPKAIIAAEKVVSAIKIIKKGTEGAQMALEAYKKAYPKLPGKIQKILPSPEHWHPQILAKINQALSSLDLSKTSAAPSTMGAASSSMPFHEDRDPVEPGLNNELTIHVMNDLDQLN